MRRRHGWKRIEVLTHKQTGVKAPIFINTLDSTFDGHVEADDMRFTGDTLQDVRSRITAYLDTKNEGFEMSRVLQVEMEGGSYSHYGNQDPYIDGTFGFKFKDIWVSVEPIGPDRSYMMCSSRYTIEDPDALMDRLRKDSSPWEAWDSDEDGVFAPPCSGTSYYAKRKIWLPYSLEAEVALRALQGQINQVRDQFIDLISSELGVKQLNDIGETLQQAALPAPEEV